MRSPVSSAAHPSDCNTPAGGATAVASDARAPLATARRLSARGRMARDPAPLASDALRQLVTALARQAAREAFRTATASNPPSPTPAEVTDD